MQDTTGAGIGDNADGVAVGRGIRQRIRRDSPNVVVQVNESLRALESELLQLQVDIKLLHAMAEERRAQVLQLQGWVVIMGVALLLQSVTFVVFVFSVWR